MNGTRLERLFVANRAEIAARIERTCRRLAITAILPERDGPAGLDLLDAEAVVGAALAARADAIHPGYGFLAESAAFATAVEAAGLTWVGPPPAAIAAMGDKAAARRLAAGLGVPVLPGYDGADQTDERLADEAARIGPPLLIKPAAGGGGKGMREVRDLAQLGASLAAARREATAAFGDDRLILERLLEGPRHVEVQVLFDGLGDGVQLGERDCSYQRRHQKVVEETPSPAVSGELRGRLGEAALALARAVGYTSAGTVEFLVAGQEFFFLEMNTRLQVEHPVTELVTGRDLVEDQLRIARGERLGFGQASVRSVGHAVEARLYAEDAEAGFLPSTGRVLALRWPVGDGIRVDAGIDSGSEVTGQFDPLLAKIVALGRDRSEALERLADALDQTVVLGLTTNLRFLRWLLARPETRRGDARVDTIESIWRGTGIEVPDWAWQLAGERLLAAAASDPVWGGGWRLNGPAAIRLATAEEDRIVRPVAAASARSEPAAVVAPDGLHLDVDGRDVVFRVAPPPEVLSAARAAARHQASGESAVFAPMPGAVLAVHVRPGDAIDGGEPVVTLAAMKMEHVVAAPAPGTVRELAVGQGDQVSRGQLLATIEGQESQR